MGWQGTSPALAQARYAAIVLIPSTLVEHARMYDVAHRHIKVVGKEVLQDL